MVSPTHLSNRMVPSFPRRPYFEQTVAEGRPTKPTTRSDCYPRNTQHHHGVQAGDLSRPCINVLLGENGPQSQEGAAASYDGCAEIDVASLAADVEEAVPRQDVFGDVGLTGGRRGRGCMAGGGDG